MSKTDGMIIEKLNSISVEKLCRFSFALALAWILSPILVVVLNAFGINSYNVCSAWLTVLYVSGGTGLVIGFVLFFKLFTTQSIKKSNLIAQIEPLIILTLFFAWCIICTLFADERIIAVYGYLTYHDNLFVYLFYAGMIMLGILLSTQKSLLSKVAKTFVGVSVVLSLLALPNNGFTSKLCRTDLTATEGCESVFYDVNHFAIYLTIATIVDVVLFLLSEKNVEKAFSLISFVILTVTLAANNTISAPIAVLLSLLIILVFNQMIGRKKSLLLLVVFVVVYCVAIKTLDIDFSFRYLIDSEVASPKAIDVSQIELGQGTFDTRKDLMSAAIKRITSNSVVGIGLQNTLSYSYNIFLQIAVYTGIPGMLIYLCSLFSMVRILVKERFDYSQITLCAALVLFGYYFTGLFGVTMFNTTPYAFLSFGVLIGGFIFKAVDFKKIKECAKKT